MKKTIVFSILVLCTIAFALPAQAMDSKLAKGAYEQCLLVCINKGGKAQECRETTCRGVYETYMQSLQSNPGQKSTLDMDMCRSECMQVMASCLDRPPLTQEVLQECGKRHKKCTDKCPGK